MPLRPERTLMAITQEILKVGIAGLGFGSTEFIPTLERLPQIKLVAGADLRPQARELFKTRFGGNVYESVSELCADPEVEAVWISTPNQFHVLPASRLTAGPLTPICAPASAGKTNVTRSGCATSASKYQ